MGLSPQQLFLEADLHEGKYLAGVAQNLLALQTRAEQGKMDIIYVRYIF